MHPTIGQNLWGWTHFFSEKGYTKSSCLCETHKWARLLRQMRNNVIILVSIFSSRQKNCPNRCKAELEQMIWLEQQQWQLHFRRLFHPVPENVGMASQVTRPIYINLFQKPYSVFLKWPSLDSIKCQFSPSTMSTLRNKVCFYLQNWTEMEVMARPDI